MVVALIALVVALGGTSYAALRVGSKQIRNNSVRTADLRNNDVRGKDVRTGSLTGGDLKNGSVTGADLAPGSVPLAASPVPKGAVFFFDTAACPAGYAELTAARGRYIVGLPSGGTLRGTAGTALSNQEDRPVGQHAHSGSAPHSHGNSTEWGFNDTADAGPVRRPIFDFKPDDPLNPDVPVTDSLNADLTINPAGTTTGTNAPYIQLRACQKQ
jgi:hypothetical protein